MTSISSDRASSYALAVLWLHAIDLGITGMMGGATAGTGDNNENDIDVSNGLTEVTEDKISWRPTGDAFIRG